MNYSGSQHDLEPVGLRWSLRLIYIAVFFIGIVGNLVVGIAIILRKRLRTSNNIFTLNLCIADLIVIVIYVPTQMAAFENDHNWPFGNFMCQVAYIIIPLCLSASIGILLAISTDRYRAIAHPLRPRLTLMNVKIIIAIIWFLSFITSIPLLFVAGTDRPDPSGKLYCSELWPRGTRYEEMYWIAIFVVQYVIPLAVIAALSRVTAMKIRQNSFFSSARKRSQIVTTAVRQRLKQSTKIAKMLIGLVLLYSICMLPQHVIYFWLKYGNLNVLSYKMYVFRLANVFPMANCALNPILYGTLNKEFAQVFKSFFAIFGCGKIKTGDEKNMESE
ncbi:predicted protein, partial [Nematostella vectensis]